MAASAGNPTENVKVSHEARMSPVELADHAWWAWFWTAIQHGAFVALIVALALEFTALKLAESHKAKLDEAKDIQIAAANKDAAQARLETEKLRRQSADRHIDADQQAALTKAIAAGPPGLRVLLSLLADKEPAQFGQELALALRNAGVSVAGIGQGNSIVPPPVGVIVETHEENPPSLAVLKALQEAGIEATAQRHAIPDSQIVRIRVGIKPNPK